MATLDTDQTDRNPLMEIDAAQQRRQWIAYAVVLTAACGMLLMLKAVAERL